MATSKIEKSVKTSVSTNEVHFTSSSTLAYTGVAIPIKANTPFILFVRAIYGNAEPQEVWITLSATDSATYDYNKIAGGNMGSTSLSGVFPTARSLYIWARYSTSSDNPIQYNLIYLE